MLPDSHSYKLHNQKLNWKKENKIENQCCFFFWAVNPEPGEDGALQPYRVLVWVRICELWLAVLLPLDGAREADYTSSRFVLQLSDVVFPKMIYSFNILS